MYASKLKPFYTAFLHSIKLSGYKVGIKLGKNTLAVERNNYDTKIVNAYIAYDLNNWRNISFRNFTLKNCLFGTTSLVTNKDKEKWVYIILVME